MSRTARILVGVFGLLLLLIPNPASLGVYRVAAIIDGRESPPWSEFWETTRANVGLFTRPA